MAELLTRVTAEPMEPRFGYSSSIMFVGSCFAQEMGRRCQEHYLDTLTNPFGVLFNPCSIADCLGLLEGYSINPYGCSFIPEDIIEPRPGSAPSTITAALQSPQHRSFLTTPTANWPRLRNSTNAKAGWS